MDRKEAINILAYNAINATGTLGALPPTARETKYLNEQIKALNMAIEALQEPQVGGVEINKDFETILLCAVRYAIGRRTYIPSLVIDYITPLLPYLSDNCLKLIADEIIDHSHDGGLGDDMIDRPYWLNFKRKILAEMERRGNEDTEHMGKESH